ncbi:hypothetical protein RFN25_07565 [Mesorhizobium abyssinicae]|uniref:hypothetical protein n=1 Tax=Mesorhizobium abyssinicae TaxID=1209958 RepID=UPI002A23AD1E|nr:hypothetical protein [Mesorhizobium abyssinicae]MDX8433291.1 hypothetical protein [Mesorhizobium abyssinicae]
MTPRGTTNAGIAFQEQLRPLSIEAFLLNTDGGAHFGHLDRGDFDFARSDWIGDYRDPEIFRHRAEGKR